MTAPFTAQFEIHAHPQHKPPTAAAGMLFLQFQHVAHMDIQSNSPLSQWIYYNDPGFFCQCGKLQNTTICHPFTGKKCCNRWKNTV